MLFLVLVGLILPCKPCHRQCRPRGEISVTTWLVFFCVLPIRAVCLSVKQPSESNSVHEDSYKKKQSIFTRLPKKPELISSDEESESSERPKKFNCKLWTEKYSILLSPRSQEKQQVLIFQRWNSDTLVFVAVSILLIVFLVTYLVACCCQGSDNKWRADENGMKPVDTVYLWDEFSINKFVRINTSVKSEFLFPHLIWFYNHSTPRHSNRGQLTKLKIKRANPGI